MFDLASGRIYVHFPYCLYKCHYCDFNSHATDSDDIPVNQYLEALRGEVLWRRQYHDLHGYGFYDQNFPIESIFLGGGTPSLMSPNSINALLGILREQFVISNNAEVTIECNPGTLNLEKLEGFYSAGVNRISMGVQSFQERNLKRFGRIHSGKEGKDAIGLVKQAPFQNMSCDLIFGFPDQTLDEWKSDLEELLSYELPHISCYALTEEEGTLYAKHLKGGELQEPDSGVVAEMMQWTNERMTAEGYQDYEISNFAKPGYESRHNLGYWRYQSYLGLGPGAWGQTLIPKRDGDQNLFCRQMVIKSPSRYQELFRLQDSHMIEKYALDSEFIDAPTAMREYLLMGLRLKTGILEEDFSQRFSATLESVFSGPLQKAISQGWLTMKDGAVFATKEGRIWHNSMLSLFFDN